MRSKISLTEEKEKIVLKILENATQEQIIESIKNRLGEIKKISEEKQKPILVNGKILKKKEIEEITDILKIKIKQEIEFETPVNLGLHGIKKVFNKEIESSDTKFYRGSLRSGNRIEYDGSIVVLGDVNHGVEIIASDNIVVLGILRGIAHAGAKGNTKAIIAAASIESPQVRIANKIKEIEKEDLEERKNYAYVEGEDVVLE